MNKKITEYTDKELREAVDVLLVNGHVMFHEQYLTQDELIEFCRRIGDTNDSNPSMGHMEFNPKDNPDLSIITTQPVGKSPHGMFGPTDLVYHGDGGMCHFGEFKELLTGLYCVGSCPDTVLSLLNTNKAFTEFSEEEKEYWRNVETQLNMKEKGIYGTIEEKNRDGSMKAIDGAQEAYKCPIYHYDDERQNVVNIHPYTGKEFMLWQPAFVDKAWYKGEPISVDEIQDKFRKALVRGKNITDFVLREGDFLICDQYYTLHRRSWVQSSDRVIWRPAFDYSNILGPDSAYNPSIEDKKYISRQKANKV
jgi:alpha-ketoglutarate-dependent taurine dioxygenase